MIEVFARNEYMKDSSLRFVEERKAKNRFLHHFSHWNIP